MTRNTLAAGLLIAICFACCSHAQTPAKSITLPKYQPNLPEAHNTDDGWQTERLAP